MKSIKKLYKFKIIFYSKMNSIEYNLNMEKSFFSKNNFYGHYSPSNLDKNMISCSKIIQFHYDTSFILNFISSLYIEIKKQENNFNYNIKKFGDLIENLNIQISNDKSPSSLSSLLLNTFTFYYKKFESETQNQNNLYSSSIPENQKPYFGDYGNILIPDNYIDNYGLIFNNSYNKKNIKSYNSECKFKEVLDEILKQKPENILGYLLYKLIYYNIILYNINIQNSVRINYLNKPLLTYNDINIEPLRLTNEIDDIRSIINDNERNIIELNRRFFINTQNDYLMEKNIYREKINSLNTIKDDFKQSQDKFNKSIRNYKYNINNYDMIKKYSKYVVYSLILIIIIVIILIYFNEKTNNNFLLFLIIILMIFLIYLFSRKFKYVIRERFTEETRPITNLNIYYIIKSVNFDSNCFFTINILSLPIYIRNDFLNNNKYLLTFNKNRLLNIETKPIIYIYFGKSFLGNNFKGLNQDLFKLYWSDELNRQNLIHKDISKFTHFKLVGLTRYNSTIYKIKSNLYTGNLPLYIYFNLTFENGIGFTNIEITPPIIMIILRQKQSYFYVPITFIILNGGSGYKTLPTRIFLDEIYFETIVNKIDFNFIINDLVRFNSYHIIKSEIVKNGYYLNYPRIDNNIIPSNCLPIISFKIDDITNKFRTNINIIKTQINNIITQIENIKNRASQTSQTFILLSSLSSLKTTLDNYITNINYKLNLANCIINKLSGISNQLPLIEGCDNGTLITINNFQTEAEEYVKRANKELIYAIYTEANISITYINKNFRSDFNLIINEMYSNITNEIFNNYKTKFLQIKTYINNINLDILNTKFITITSNKNNIADKTLLSEIVNIKNICLTLGNDLYIIRLKIEILLIIMPVLKIANLIIISTNQALEYAKQANINVINAIQYSILFNNYMTTYISDIRRLAGTNIEGFTCDIEESSALNEANIVKQNALSFISETQALIDFFLDNNKDQAEIKSQKIININIDNIKNANIKALCYKEKTDTLLNLIITLINEKKLLIENCSSLRTLNPTNKIEIDKHSSVYNFLVPYINNYANTIEEIMNNMRMNILTLGNKSFIMDKNIYLYELYLKKKKEITEFKLKFTDYVNKTELVRSNSKDLYNFIIFLIITYIIIIIGIYIYLYLIPSLLFVIIFIIIMIIIVMIFFTFKLGVSTRMLADKYYWSMMTLKKID